MESRDLQSKWWIVAKGVMFLGIAILSTALLLVDSPKARTFVFAGLLAWASARFYYFLFYVLEKYVDPRLKYAGVIALIQALLARRVHPTASQDDPIESK